jgi:outer membrane biosynthesis protein TonB
MMQAMEGFPMSLPSLLLLTSLLTAPLAATDAAQPAAQPDQITSADVLAAQTAAAQQPFALLTPGPNRDFAGESDGICYKIRAYIFKHDDDHAPELKGTTTCGPRQPRAKEVVRPKARLVPAE